MSGVKVYIHDTDDLIWDISIESGKSYNLTREEKKAWFDDYIYTGHNGYQVVCGCILDEDGNDISIDKGPSVSIYEKDINTMGGSHGRGLSIVQEYDYYPNRYIVPKSFSYTKNYEYINDDDSKHLFRIYRDDDFKVDYITNSTGKNIRLKLYRVKVYASQSMPSPTALKLQPTTVGGNYAYVRNIDMDNFNSIRTLFLYKTVLTYDELLNIINNKITDYTIARKIVLYPITLQKCPDVDALIDLCESKNITLYLYKTSSNIDVSNLDFDNKCLLKVIKKFEPENPIFLIGVGTISSSSEVDYELYIPCENNYYKGYASFFHRNTTSWNYEGNDVEGFYYNESPLDKSYSPVRFKITANSTLENDFYKLTNDTDDEKIFTFPRNFDPTLAFQQYNDNITYIEFDLTGSAFTDTYPSFICMSNLKKMNIMGGCSQYYAFAYNENLEEFNTGYLCVFNGKGMFQGCTSLKTIGSLGKGFEGSISSAYSMFSNCTSLETIDISSWNASNITSAGDMFYNCTSLTDVGNLTNWDVSKITSFYDMFSHCSALTNVGDLTNWNISASDDIAGMFRGCSNLASIGDLSNWDTSNIAYASHLFSDCKSLTSVGDLSKWRLKKVNAANYMFSGCESLENIGDLSNLFEGNTTLIEADQVFYRCKKLTDASFISNWPFSKIYTASSLFKECTSLETVDVSKWDTSALVNYGSMFQGCTNLKTIKGIDKLFQCTSTGLGDWYRKCYYMFDGCKSLSSDIDGSSWNLSLYNDFQYMFSSCESLKNINLTGCVMPSTDYNVDHMFSGCSSIETLDVSFLNEHVTNLSSFLYGCSSLKTITGIEDLNTSNVTNMMYMFRDCESIESLDLSKWNVDKATSMGEFLAGCKNLKSIKMPTMNSTTNRSLYYAFYKCESLTNIDLSSLSCPVSNISQAFYGCTSLVSLDISNIDFSEMTINTPDIVTQCSSLTTLKMKKFPTSSSVTIHFNFSPLNDETMQYLVDNATGGCRLMFSATTQALENYATYKAALINKGFTIS